jgi:predicted nucleotidyltransferase component of viral defense system
VLDVSKHDRKLREILRDVYTSPELINSIAFKGGTCLYMFYGLDRFSVDLDFNITNDYFPSDKLHEILARHLSQLKLDNKNNTWLWIGNYEAGHQSVKIEISKRDYPDKYTTNDLYGIIVPTMEPSYMFAHKLCAISDRTNLKSRDLYDAHFMFKKGFEINSEIIRLRTGLSTEEYFKKLVTYIDENISPTNVLDGLGELLTDQQKDSTRATLKRDILFDLRSRLPNT